MAFKSRKQYDAYWQNRLNNYTAPTFNGLEYVPFSEFRAARHPVPGHVQGTGFVGSSSTPGGSNASAGSSVLGELARSALGNIGGTALSTLANGILQHQQLKNQEQLQDRAQRINQQAVQDQAQLQTIGMQNAGLNPASVQGNGAPTVQAGAAAGSTAQMGNIFSGIAEIIQAVKAPTEMDKMVAEARLAGAQTGQAEASTEEIGTRVKQFNDYDTFVRENGPAMFADRRAALQAGEIWDNLSERTKATINGLADGDLPLSAGALKAIQDDVAAQKSISDADYETFATAVKAGILLDQIQDKDVWKALVKDPENQLRNMKENWKTQFSQRALMAEQGKTEAKSRQKMDNEIVDIQGRVTERLLDMDMKQLHDIHKLWNDGRYKDVAIRLGLNTTEAAVEVVKNVVPALLLKRGLQVAGGNRSITPPTDKEIKMYGGQGQTTREIESRLNGQNITIYPSGFGYNNFAR